MGIIQEQLKKAEDIFNAFKTEFEKSVFDEIKSYYSVEKLAPEVDQLLEAYTEQMFNMADSVVEKDCSYPEYRMIEEVDAMRTVLSKNQLPLQNAEFLSRIHQRTKFVIVQFFGEVFNLSGNGFRVLELYSRLYTYEFVSAITPLIKN